MSAARTRQSIATAADTLCSVELDALDRALLHDRVESKVVMPTEDVPAVLARLSSQYRVLEHEGTRLQPYRSEYFDSPDLRNYIEHHNQRRARLKVRYRTYVNSGVTFFEIKQNIDGRTVKTRRRSVPPTQAAWARDRAFFEENTGRLDPLVRSITITYDRILLVRRDFSERVTIDLALTFEGTEMSTGGLGFAICEFKQPRFNRRSPAMLAVSQRPQKFSKYCMGLAACNPSLKRNRFKKVFRGLDALGAPIVPVGC